MRLKIAIILIVLFGIIFIALFGSSIKEKALTGMVEDIPEYNCGKDSLCTSCIIDGHSCSCGEHVCDCGNATVDRTACALYA